MRKSNWTTSIVPNSDDQTVYIVLDDFGSNGQAYRETDPDGSDLETVILDLLEGQYGSPVRVIGFNTTEGWSRDVSADVAQELRQRCDLQETSRFSCKTSVTSSSGTPTQLPLPIRLV